MLAAWALGLRIVFLYGGSSDICRNNLRRRKVIPFSLEKMIEDLGTEPISIDNSSPDPQQVLEQKELHAAFIARSPFSWL